MLWIDLAASAPGIVGQQLLHVGILVPELVHPKQQNIMFTRLWHVLQVEASMESAFGGFKHK